MILCTREQRRVDQMIVKGELCSRRLVVSDLRREVVPDVALTKVVRHQQWHIIAHHELNTVAQTRALGEVDEILQREGERDMRVHFDAHAGLVFVVRVIGLTAFAFLR